MTSSDTKILMRFRITTPMFCSAADIDNAELRLPSIKGLLRYWWRVSQSGSYSDPGELLKRENMIFGSTELHSQVKLRFVSKDDQPPRTKGEKFGYSDFAGLHYLAFGCVHPFGKDKDKLIRGMIPGGCFTMEARLPRKFLQDLLQAIRLLGAFGGIGSRSRKGFGSVSLSTIEVDDVPEKIGLAEAIERLGQITSGIPEWTSFSKKARLIECVSASDSAVDMLNCVGSEFVHYRCWGYKGKVLNFYESEKNFIEDHDLFHEISTECLAHPKRIVFGLPHNYHSRGISKSVKPDKLERRASPMFISIYQPAEDQPPKAHILFLPSRFLPEGEKLMSFGRRVEVKDSDFDTFWSPINDFLDRLISTDENARKTSIRGREVRIG